MVELNKKSLAAAIRRETEYVCTGDYEIDLKRLSSDIDALKKVLAEAKASKVDLREAKTAAWVLEKWQMMDRIHISCSVDNRKLVFKDKETECGAARILGAEHLYSEERQLAEFTGNMNAKYLSMIGHPDATLMIVDHSELADAIAFEYAINDIGVDAHSLVIWTKEATIYTVNPSKIFTNMVMSEMETQHSGQAYEIIQSLMVNSACARVQLSGDTILTYMGEKISIDKTGHSSKRFYKEALIASSDEIVCTLVGKVATSQIKNSLRLVGYTNRMQMAFMVHNSIDPETIKDELAAVARILNKRYEFIPKIYKYDKTADKFELVGQED